MQQPSSSSSSTNASLRLPDYFPRSSKSCLDTSNKFFTCFTEASLLTPENCTQLNVGRQGLEKCVKELNAYEKCMMNDKKWKHSSSYRVSLSFQNLVIQLVYESFFIQLGCYLLC